jgi:hypothetical protein
MTVVVVRLKDGTNEEIILEGLRRYRGRINFDRNTVVHSLLQLATGSWLLQNSYSLSGEYPDNTWTTGLGTVWDIFQEKNILTSLPRWFDSLFLFICENPSAIHPTRELNRFEYCTQNQILTKKTQDTWKNYFSRSDINKTTTGLVFDLGLYSFKCHKWQVLTSDDTMFWRLDVRLATSRHADRRFRFCWNGLSVPR